MKKDKEIGRQEFFQRLQHKIDPQNLRLVLLAYKLAKYGHKNQSRKTGERYFMHPKACALILIDELKIYDYEMLCGMLMHDLPEDSFILDFDDIQHIFGPAICSYVETMTKTKSSEEEKIKDTLSYFRRFFDAGEKVSIMKLTDRLHNMRTLPNTGKIFQIKQTRETIEYLLPLAKDTNHYLYCQLKNLCNHYRGKYLESFIDLKPG